MILDSCYIIGSTHNTCQDYSLAFTSPTKKFIAISDGCSSSPNSDFGSRILIKACQNTYLTNPTSLAESSFIDKVWTYAQDSVKIISNIEQPCLDATLLFAYISGKTIHVTMVGDGTVSLKAKDGMIFTKTIDYKDNAPLYLGYLYSKERRDLLNCAFDCTKTITEYMHKNGAILNSTKRISTNDIEHFSFDIEDYESITLFSDGVSSFIHQNDIDYVRIPEHVMVEHLIKFKNSDGGYTPNHFYNVHKMFSSECKINTDDFSAASFFMSE